MIEYKRNKSDLHIGDILYLKMMPADGNHSFSVYVLVEVTDLTAQRSAVEVMPVAGDSSVIWVPPSLLWERVKR
jgi:hypothetical protein